MGTGNPGESGSSGRQVGDNQQLLETWLNNWVRNVPEGLGMLAVPARAGEGTTSLVTKRYGVSFFGSGTVDEFTVMADATSGLFLRYWGSCTRTAPTAARRWKTTARAEKKMGVLLIDVPTDQSQL